MALEWWWTGRYSEGFAGSLSKKPRKTTKSLASSADVPDGTGTGAFRIQTWRITATPTRAVIMPCVLRCDICFRRRNWYLRSSAADLSHPWYVCSHLRKPFRKPLQWNYKPSTTLSCSTLKMKPLVLSLIPSTKASCLWLFSC